MKWQKIILHAIQNKLKLSFIYDDEIRIIAPHIFGVNTLGHLVLSSVQDIKSWRTFDLEKISNLKILKDHFSVDKDYNPEDPHFKFILGKVKGPR